MNIQQNLHGTDQNPCNMRFSGQPQSRSSSREHQYSHDDINFLQLLCGIVASMCAPSLSGLTLGRFQCRFHIPQCVKQSIFLLSCWMATRICFTKKVKVSTENRILMKTQSNTKPGTLTSRCFPVSEHREHPYTCLVNFRHPCLQCFCRVQHCYMTKWLRCVHYCYVTRDSLFSLGEQNPENLDHWVGNGGHWVGNCPPS